MSFGFGFGYLIRITYAGELAARGEPASGTSTAISGRCGSGRYTQSKSARSRGLGFTPTRSGRSGHSSLGTPSRPLTTSQKQDPARSLYVTLSSKNSNSDVTGFGFSNSFLSR